MTPATSSPATTSIYKHRWRTPIGYDSLDHVLDIVVAPDGTWHWKDEDEFEEAIQLGLFTPSEAADIRAEGERVITRLSSLLPTGWEHWRPPPRWSVSSLSLPEELSDHTHVCR